MTPMRVLHITGDSHYGGAGPIIIGLGRIAQAEGWQVDVLSTDPVFQRAIARHGLGIVDLDVIRREIRPVWDLSGLVRLAQFLRREQYAIVHTHTSKAGFVGRLAARLAHIPVIVHTVHGFAFHERSPHRTQLFYTALERAAAHWCHRIVSVSEFHRRWALELKICDSSQIVAIPNGIARLPKPAVAPPELRRSLGVRPSDLMMLTMARLAPDKGLSDLIEAAAILARYDRRFLVVIAGEGSARAALENQARERGVADHVAFLGFREDVSELLEAADLVVLPSLREGLSIALLEAMAAAKPIIATSIGSHKELISQGNIACLVPPGDAIALSDAILRLARDPVLMARLATRAKDLFEKQYTEDRMLKAYRHLYFDLLTEQCQANPALAGSICAVRPQGAAEIQEPVDAGDISVRVFKKEEVRQATVDDLPGIVCIHQKAFSDFFLTRLGPAFLARYYELVLNYRAGIALVGERKGKLLGFACGFVDPAEFYRLMWSSRRTFALSAFAALVRRPSLVTGVLQGVQRIQTSAAGKPANACELSSIAVAPDAAGYGLGKVLIQAFVARAELMEAGCVYLTTDADNNDQANALYRQSGFRHTQRFLQRKGRWMNEYVIDQMDAELVR